MADATTEITGRVSDGTKIRVPVEAGEILYAGTLVCIDAQGYAIDATDAADQKPIGVVVDTVDNSAGADGDKDAEVWLEGVFDFVIAATHTIADVGKHVYITDNQTVTLTPATNNGPIGYIVECLSTTKTRVKLQILPVDTIA